jgi:hypothetical protein
METNMNSKNFMSEFLVRNLTDSVTGDDGFFPYRKGQALVLLFNRFGFKDMYPESLEGSSRSIYTRERIKQTKDLGALKKLVETIVDPKEFFELGITIDNAVVHLNEYLKLEGYEVRHDGSKYQLFSNDVKIIEPKTVNTISHEFITEQIDKCQEKIATADYDGAITNARSLIEAVCIQIIEKTNKQQYNSSGDLVKIFKDLKKSLNMTIDKEDYPLSLKTIISGLDSIVNGISDLSNGTSDRHNRIYKPQKHHAKLAVNCAFSFCDFIIESFLFQQDKKIRTNPCPH